MRKWKPCLSLFFPLPLELCLTNFQNHFFANYRWKKNLFSLLTFVLIRMRSECQVFSHLRVRQTICHPSLVSGVSSVGVTSIHIYLYHPHMHHQLTTPTLSSLSLFQAFTFPQKVELNHSDHC